MSPWGLLAPSSSWAYRMALPRPVGKTPGESSDAVGQRGDARRHAEQGGPGAQVRAEVGVERRPRRADLQVDGVGRALQRAVALGQHARDGPALSDGP